MRARWVGILIAGIFVLAVLGLDSLFHWRTREDAPFLSVVPSLQKIQLEENGQSVTLSRNTPQDPWQVTLGTATVLESDPVRVRRLISGLQTLLVDDIASRNPAEAERFGITPSSATYLRLFNREGQLLRGGLFGNDVANQRRVYLQLIETGPIYIAQGLTRNDVRVGHFLRWRNPRVLSVPPGLIQRVKIQTAQFLTVLEKRSGSWFVNGVAIGPERVDSFLTELTQMNVGGFLEPTANAAVYKRPLRSLTMDVNTTDNRSVRLQFGEPDPAQGVVPVRMGASEPYLAWVLPDQLERLAKRPGAFTQRVPR